MGFFDRLTGKRAIGLLSNSTELGIASPWAESEGILQPLVLSDIFGTDIDRPLTRGDAISIPAVSKARNLLVSTIAKWPLVAMKGDAELPADDQPTFLYRTNSTVSPHERMVWTIDCGIFHGVALWEVTRGEAKDGRRPILDAAYVPKSEWKIEDGQILLRDQPADADDVLLFNFPSEGLLNIAKRTLRGALDQEAAWVGRARNPIPLIELHQTDDTLSDEEVKPFVSAWSTARRSPDGAIGYTPQGLEVIVHGDVPTDLMIEGRNAVRTDVGSFVNVRVAMLDGTIGVDSLTYTTKDGERNSFYEFDVPFWSDAIEQRLSLDDVVPRGTRVRFVKYGTAQTPAETGPNVED